MTPSLHGSLDSLCQRWSDSKRVGSLSLRVKDRLGEEYVYPRDDQSRHLIASVSKTFFAAATFIAARKKLVALDQPAAGYLPPGVMAGLCVVDGVDHSETVTVSDLLSHRSGIPDYYRVKALKPARDMESRTQADPGWSFDEALDIARTLPGAFLPGSGKSHYSFTNYQLIGRLLSEVTGGDLSSVVREYITEPLGLDDTSLLTPDTLDLFDRAEPIVYGTQRYRGARRMASLGAEGAVVSSTRDVMTFLDALSGGGLVSAKEWERMVTPLGSPFPAITYGHGVMTLSLPRVVTRFWKVPSLVGHSGATGSFMFMEPVSGVKIVGTINQIGRPLDSVRFMAQVARVLTRE
jgi:D-alanyl-D-alanine carboxypeptidase